MKTLATKLAPIAFALASLTAWAQSPGGQQPGGQAQPVQANLNLIIAQVQKAALATNGDLGKLRIEKWKTDADQKDQLQKMSDSIQRNLTNAIPGLIGDVQNSRGGVAATFKLYHNITIVYEYLTSLTDAAGVLGKKEEYEPLAAPRALPAPPQRMACAPLRDQTGSSTSLLTMCLKSPQLIRRKRLPSRPPNLPPLLPASPPPRLPPAPNSISPPEFLELPPCSRGLYACGYRVG